MSMIYVSEVLRVAAAEVGYVEKASNYQLDDKVANAGNANWNKYFRDLWNAQPHFYQSPKNPNDWCCGFVDWCLYMAAKKDSKAAQTALCYTGPYGAGCGMSVMYYREAGRFWERDKADPRPGDQIFFGTAESVAHTGLVEEVSANTITTIEGNSGNAVRRKIYARSASNIYGYGRPRYNGDAPPEPEPEPLPFTDIKAGSWSEEAIRWAWENRIMVGTSATTFSPKKPMTREQAAVMLKAACSYMEQRLAAMIREALNR